MDTLLTLERLEAWYEDHKEEIFREYFSLLRFPSISTDPQFKGACQDTASWLCQWMQKRGLQAEVWKTAGHPVVWGTHQSTKPGRPTLLIYHHYDVQPVDPEEQWLSLPFEPEVREGRIYARGASDNKGQCFYSLTAIRAVLDLAKELDLNLKIFIEGEEESGSASATRLLQEKQKELQADYLLAIDFGISALSSPEVNVGMRGLLALEVECSNSSVDLHSGVHGGIALNPNRALATLLAGLWDAKGRVTLPHFYEGIEPLTKEDLARVDLSFDQKQYQEAFGVHAFCPEEGYSIKEANGLRPTVEINGMLGGYTGTGVKTVIPARALAKLSCRLVPGQDPQKVLHALTDYFEKKAPKGLTVKVTPHQGAFAYRSSLNSSIVKTVVLAYEEVFGKPCRYAFCGASVPIVVDLARVSGAEVVMMGVSLPEDDIHAPNEHFSLEQFKKGYLTLARVLARLSSL